jgi:hypothetical protein
LAMIQLRLAVVLPQAIPLSAQGSDSSSGSGRMPSRFESFLFFVESGGSRKL